MGLIEYCQKKLEIILKFKYDKIETLLLHDHKILFTQNGIKVFKI